MSNFLIIVYGANGYTGKLISEYLTKQKLPFIAAGRSQGKLEAAVAELPAGTEVQIKTVEHNEAALTELFQGASIVVNVVGPFGQLGEPVVKAALAAGCHYIDTTGEGDYAIRMLDNYSTALSFLRMGCLPQYLKEDGGMHEWPANTTQGNSACKPQHY